MVLDKKLKYHEVGGIAFGKDLREDEELIKPKSIDTNCMKVLRPREPHMENKIEKNCFRSCLII